MTIKKKSFNKINFINSSFIEDLRKEFYQEIRHVIRFEIVYGKCYLFSLFILVLVLV